MILYYWPYYNLYFELWSIANMGQRLSLPQSVGGIGIWKRFDFDFGFASGLKNAKFREPLVCCGAQ